VGTFVVLRPWGQTILKDDSRRPIGDARVQVGGLRCLRSPHVRLGHPPRIALHPLRTVCQELLLGLVGRNQPDRFQIDERRGGGFAGGDG